jgi:hypothetical protein
MKIRYMRKILTPLFFFLMVSLSAQWVQVADYPYIVTDICFDNQGNRFVALQQGHVIRNQDTLLSLPVHFFNEAGLTSVLWHNEYLYLHVSGLDSIQRVIQWDEGMLDTLVEVPYKLPFTTQHRGGDLVIVDSLLYSSFGYGGDPLDSQDTLDWRGKIIQTNLNTGISRMYAWGLRNPFRMSYGNNRLYVADVGSNVAEEINVSYGGENFGWPFQEGDQCSAFCDSVTLPVYWYSQSQPRYIIGGAVFNHRYYFTDGGSGVGGYLDSLDNYTELMTPLDMTSMAVSRADGRLYGSDWIGHIFLYDQLPLSIDTIYPSKPYTRNRYGLTEEELFEIFGHGVIDMSGRMFGHVPDVPGYYYQIATNKWFLR